MEKATKAGYTLIEEVSILGRTYVMGRSPSTASFVTWYKPKEDSLSYGHYFDNEADARRDMILRAMELMPEQETDLLAGAIMSDAYRQDIIQEARAADDLEDIENCLHAAVESLGMDDDMVETLMGNPVFRDHALHTLYRQDHSAENEALSQSLEELIRDHFPRYLPKEPSKEVPSTSPLSQLIASAKDQKGRGEAITDSEHSLGSEHIRN